MAICCSADARGMLKDGALRGLQALLKLLLERHQKGTAGKGHSTWSPWKVWGIHWARSDKSEEKDLAGLNAEVVDGCRKEFQAGKDQASAASRSGQSSAQDRQASRSNYIADAIGNLVSGAAAGGVYR